MPTIGVSVAVPDPGGAHLQDYRITLGDTEARGIPSHITLLPPYQVEETDLATAALVVALKELEHRTMMWDRFPAWEERILYWHVDDLGDGPVEDALASIDREVQALLARLQEAAPHA